MPWDWVFRLWSQDVGGGRVCCCSKLSKGGVRANASSSGSWTCSGVAQSTNETRTHFLQLGERVRRIPLRPVPAGLFRNQLTWCEETCVRLILPSTHAHASTFPHAIRCRKQSGRWKRRLVGSSQCGCKDGNVGRHYRVLLPYSNTADKKFFSIMCRANRSMLVVPRRASHTR